MVTILGLVIIESGLGSIFAPGNAEAWNQTCQCSIGAIWREEEFGSCDILSQSAEPSNHTILPPFLISRTSSTLSVLIAGLAPTKLDAAIIYISTAVRPHNNSTP